jgi:hypothetical protein
MKPNFFILLTLLISGCATTQTIESTGPRPTNYKQAVKDHVKESFFDPYSIRDAEISQPLMASAVFDGVTPIPHSGWIVCFKANAKNRMGGYTGRQLTGLLFDGESIKTVIGEPTHAVAHHCENAVYETFDTAA